MESGTQSTPSIAQPLLRWAAAGLLFYLVLLFAVPPLIFAWLPGGIAYITLVILMLAFMLSYCGVILRRTARTRPDRNIGKEIGLGVLLGLLMVGVLSAVEHLVFDGGLAWPQQIHDLLTAPRWAQITMAVLAIAAVPAAEELFFRGLIQGAVRRYHVAGAICVQAIIFAALHFYGLSYSVFVFAGGLTFGLIYEWRKTLVTPIAAHTLANIITVILIASVVTHQGPPPSLGVQLDDTSGVCVAVRTMPGSAAEEAGLQAGDRFITIADQPITTGFDVVNIVQSCQVGQTITMVIDRNGETLRLKAKLKARP